MPATGTKRQLVEQAYTECALNGWELDITPEEKSVALTRLDMLMNELEGRGLALDYNFPVALGGGDLDEILGCDDQAFYALAVLLAERIAPTMGKVQSLASRQALESAMKALRAMATVLVPSMQFANGTPWGSGNRPWATRYAYVPPVTATDPSALDGGTP